MVYWFNGGVINTYYCWEPQLPGQKYSVNFSFLLTLKIRCNELQPRLETSLSTKSHQAVFAQQASRYISKSICTDDQEQGWADPKISSHPIRPIPGPRSWALWRGEPREPSKWAHVPLSSRSIVQFTSTFPTQVPCAYGYSCTWTENKGPKSNPKPALHCVGRNQLRTNPWKSCSDPTNFLILLCLTGERLDSSHSLFI